MSTDTTLWFGPLAVCKNPFREVFLEIQACTWERCPLRGEEVRDEVGFCPRCGKGVGPTTSKTSQKALTIQLDEETIDELLGEGFNLIVGPSADYIHSGMEEEDVWTFPDTGNADVQDGVFHAFPDGINIPKELATARGKAEPLFHLYGKKNVKIVWGVTTEIS
jgi:hypothetical protein